MSLTFHVVAREGTLDLDLAGEFAAPVTGVFGPSGAGKSSLIHCLAGIRRPDKGFVSFRDQILFDAAKKVNLPAHRRNIGVVFQRGRLFPHLTVRGNLRYGRGNLTDPLLMRQMVDLLGLEPLLNAKPLTLSGGEIQRVALARALLAEPHLLLLDEPLSALDRPLRRQILPYLRRIRDQVAIPMVIISHDLGELLQLTDQLYLVDQGRCVDHGPFLKLARESSVIDRFHGAGLLNVLPAMGGTDHRSANVHPVGVVAGAPWYAEQAVPPGQACYLGLRPEDISLVRQPVSGLSIRNQVPGKIRHLTLGRNRVYCEVQVAAIQLLVEITHDAMHDLALTVEQPIWCLFKAQALRVLD